MTDSDIEDDDDEMLATAQLDNEKHHGYFFPSLAQQRRVYCLDILKRDDIRSVSFSAIV